MNAINNPNAATRIAAPVMDAVQSASARTGIDFDYLVDVARVASLRTAIANGSYGVHPAIIASAMLDFHGGAE